MTDIIVYVLDLPLDMEENDLEKLIQTRVETTQRMKVNSVKCYLKLGIAVINMMNEDDKSHLVFTVESVVLDKNLGRNISFATELELDCYIIIDKNISKIPFADEVARRYSQVYKTSNVRTCETVSVQFPNIFRIISSTLDEMVKTANTPDFKIDTSFATVYPRSDCSFFEDLPPHTNEEKLTSAICTQIGESHLSPTSFYVQHNRETGNAVIIASKSVKKWMTEGYLAIDGRHISKKLRLAYRVLVSPVPSGFNVGKILRNPLFAGQVVSNKHIDDKLIIELKDLDHYNHCLAIGGVGIEGKLMAIKPHAVVSDPDSNELDAFNWYETAMLDIKPDITTIINDHQHPIFRYKWNAENWNQQMKKAETTGGHSKGYDLIRHLLRVTVMLNTIAILRKKKYVVDEKEITLKLERMRTIGYDHKATLLKGKKIFESELKTPYSLTTVKVINEDCLVLYEQLIAEGHRPLILNMANKDNPGGGYRKGDGAQEENLFRRSDYYESLDGELANKDRSERLFYTEKCELKPLKGFAAFYPMEEFGAIYTSGITVFRGTEAKGYPYMKEPLYDVSAIAMAAYREPPLTPKNMLQNKAAMNTRKKIENIFAIGYQHKHDCLLLSALGCGAFKNPPEHIALLFKSVIYQYAGYFHTIYFAIIDDHNAKGRINPNGNFAPFNKILNDLKVPSPTTLRVNGVTGPHRILDKTSDGQLTLSDVCISYQPPCQHGNNCRDLRNADHNHQFSHPPRCSLQSATSVCDQMNDDVHVSTFSHTIKCEKGGECPSKDAGHLIDYDHPEFCKDQSHCCDISPEHLFAYRHLPVCRDGIDCSKYLNHEDDHTKLFRHCKSICPEDNCCSQYHDDTHTKKTIHSFRPPCPFTPYNCNMYVQFMQKDKAKGIDRDVERHCLEYSHVCLYGRQCKTTDDKHYETTIHIARHFCPDENKCTKLTKEDHLESFTHPSIRDIRLFCNYPGFKCRQRFDEDHLKRYRHGQNYDQLAVAPSSNLNSHINFVQNQRHLIRNVNNYIDTAKWKKAKISTDIFNWIRALQPVHRCGKLIFESILVHGHVMSRQYMTRLERPTYVAKAVLQHNQVRFLILRQNNRAVKENAERLVKALVLAEFAKTGADGITKLDPDHEEQVNIAKMKLKVSLDDHDLKTIYDWTVKIAQASIALHGAPMGIGFDVDQRMGTDKQVFSILGPHLGHYYGDIVITFKQELMFHPDTNFSIQAATSFNSGRTYKNHPWVTDPGTPEKRVEDFHRAKLHCSVPRYENAAATELVALTGIDTQSMDVNLNAVIRRWKTVDSHDTFEAHLPQLIPLDYVDCVYMPKNLFGSLTPEAQKSTKELFKNSLIIWKDDVDLSLLKTGGTVPLDATRKTYLKFILDQLDQKIQERIDKPQISRGIVITVPGSNFDEHTVLPMTISQSYDLYLLDNNTAPQKPENTYIYWQAMNEGDMMLTIASEKVEPGKNQPNLRCLIVYVAEKPSTATQNYHENYSYLNDGHPLHHDTNVHAGKFKAKSNVFYRGCNNDDFFTFCLKLSHKTGEVTLSHAGPNGIYNHANIYYQFNKSDLDLSKIDYLHVSGGNHDVPIRNLTINYEPVLELQPSFDKDFKINTSGLLGKRRGSVDHTVHAFYHAGAPKDNDKVVSYPRRRRAATAEPAPPPEKIGFFRRLKDKILGPNVKDNPSASNQSPSRQEESNFLEDKSPAYNRSRDESPRSKPPRARTPSPRFNPPRAKSPPRSPQLISSKLPACRDSIYCLNQNVKDHTEEFSHPCRFNELCRRQADEPHLIHQRHKVPKCTQDKDCSEKTNPVHRAEYRHTGLPDYLIPCRHQETCYDKSDEHRRIYFHGEEIPSVKKNKSLAPALSGGAPKALIRCQYGSDCRSTKDPKHTAKYSHPT